MALLRVDFYSRYLQRNVILTAVIPVDKMDGDKLAKRRQGPYRTVTFCTASLAVITTGSTRRMWCKRPRPRDIALIMPSVKTACTSISPRSTNGTASLFPRSSLRLRAGCSRSRANAKTPHWPASHWRLHRTHQRVAAARPLWLDHRAFRRVYARPRARGAGSRSQRKRRYYERFFGDLDTVMGSEKDYLELACRFNQRPHAAQAQVLRGPVASPTTSAKPIANLWGC